MKSGPPDRRLARYVRRTVYPYSAHYRPLLDAAGLGSRVQGRAGVARLTPTDLALINDPGALVLRPDLRRIMRHGRPALAALGATARVAGAMPAFSRHVARRFKPVLWVLAEGVPIGYSAHDSSRLARRGVAWLRRAGVSDRDVLVSVLPAGPSVAHWQLVLGCRRLGVSALLLGPDVTAEDVARFGPTVIAGDPVHLTTLLSDARRGGRPLAGLRTVLAVGPPLGGDRRARLADVAIGAAVVGAWAPPGVRALWSECRAGATDPAPNGYHAWDDDVLERAVARTDGAADGEVLWTGVGWAGSALLRLRTYCYAGVEPGPCSACGDGGPLVVPHGPVARAARPALAQPERSPASVEAVFAREPEVAAWLVEYRFVNGSPETIVTLAPGGGADVAPLLQRLDTSLRATQFVVVSADEVAARVRDAGGRIIGAPSP